MTRAEAVWAVAIFVFISFLAGCGGGVDEVAGTRDGTRDEVGGTPARGVPDPALGAVEPRVATAIAEARQSLLDDPSSSARWGRLGTVLAAHDFLADAAACFRRAAELAPRDERWPYLAARVLRTLDLDAAVEQFARAVELRPRHAAVHLHYGDALLEAGDPEAAAGQYRRALELDPDSPWALVGLGRSALLAGDLDDARARLEAAVAEMPELREAHLLLAQVAQRLGDAEAARHHLWTADNHPETSSPPDPLFEPVVEAGVSSVWASRRGLAHARAGRLEAAEAELRAALEAAPESARDWANLGGVLAGQRRYDEALDAYRRALDLDPREVLAHSNLAQTLIELGRLDEAEEQLEAALDADPRHLESLLNLGVVRLRQRRFEAAIGLFRRALDVAPGDLRALDQLGRALVLAGRPAEAVEFWRRAVAIDPRRLEVLYNLAVALSELGEHGEAIELLRRGVGEAPNSSRLVLHLAWELAAAPDPELRDGSAAVALAERVRKSYPSSPRTADVLAAAHAEAGDFTAAVATAERALALADEQGQGALSAAIQERLAGYRAGEPFRLPAR